MQGNSKFYRAYRNLCLRYVPYLSYHKMRKVTRGTEEIFPWEFAF
ncbi:hypothetical protein RUMCAL_02197 [Ruminococcus callidus ATCC 27760]|uniref:Uncharacterized protein n=1 Tax=Ruminococcus callidus ATCC 27760 TaxID=411473 RepID=U2KNB2_9FIRM|nr:hypothetical protein RUMCAL_02197 [Ruminococcus callidus ATCC 27760]